VEQRARQPLVDGCGDGEVHAPVYRTLNQWSTIDSLRYK